MRGEEFPLIGLHGSIMLVIVYESYIVWRTRCSLRFSVNL